MMNRKILSALILCILFFTGIRAQDRNILVNEVYPDAMFLQNGGRYINVQQLAEAGIHDVNAAGDGITDDSDAIVAAMDWVMDQLKDHFASGGGVHWKQYYIIYFPNGTYKITKPLVYSGERVIDPLFSDNHEREGTEKLMIVGQSREGTIIKLADNTEGFGADVEKPMVSFSKFDENTIFNNMPAHFQFRNFTLDAGTGNPGAIGVDFYGANIARLDNVKIIGDGKIGLHIRIGSAHGYLSNITVEGFDYGIYLTGNTESHPVFEYVTLRDQNVNGLYIDEISSSFRKLYSNNSAQAIRIRRRSSRRPHLVIFDSRLEGGSAQNNAITIEKAFVFARNIEISGYGNTLLKDDVVEVESGSIEEYCSEEMKYFDGARIRKEGFTSMNLPVLDYPLVKWEEDFSQWANVDSFGAAGNGTSNDTEEIQAAMNSGKPVIFFPKNAYYVAGTVYVPASVKHIIGAASLIRGGGVKFDVSQSSPDILVFDNVNLDGGTIRHSAERDLFLESTHSAGNVYDSELKKPGNKVFVNNTHGFARLPGTIENVDVWDRWNNNEKTTPWQFNVGKNANYWMMGFKSEKTFSVFQVTDGARLEVMGGIMNRFGTDADPDEVGIYIKDSDFSGIMASNGPNRNWDPMIKDQQNGVEKTLAMTDFPDRGWDNNIVLSLYASYNPEAIPEYSDFVDMVKITSPEDGRRYGLNANISFDILANLADTIQSIELWVNGVKTDETSEYPYSFNWSTSTPGHYSFLAKAIGKHGGSNADSISIYVYDPALSRLDLIQDTIYLSLGDSVYLEYNSLDQFDFPFEVIPDWSTSNGGKVTDAQYFVPNDTTGSYKVFISSGGEKDSVLVEVYEPYLLNIIVYPPDTILAFNEEVQFMAEGYDQYHHTLKTQPSFIWELSGDAGTLNNDGLFIAGELPDTCMIVASYEEIADTALLYVVEPGTQWSLFHNIKGVWGSVPLEEQVGYLHDGDTLTFPDITNPEGGNGAYIALKADYPEMLFGVRYFGRSDKPSSDPIYERALGTLFQSSMDSSQGYTDRAQIEEISYATWHEVKIPDVAVAYLRTLFPDESYGNLSEVEYITNPLMHTIETVWGGAPVPFNEPDFAGAALFDRNTNTFPDITAPTSGFFVGYQFDKPRDVNYIRLFPRSDKGSADPIFQRPVGSKIQVSGNGEDWTTIYTITEDDLNHNEWSTIEISGDSLYDYGRILFSENSYGNLAEIMFLEALPKVTDVQVTPQSIELEVGENAMLTVVVMPEDAGNKQVSFNSSDPAIASVDEKGLVSANVPGSAIITVTTEDGGISAECSVTVIDDNAVEKINHLFKLYPNPANEFIRIYADFQIQEIVLFDLSGKIEKRVTDLSPGNIVFSLKGIASGFHILKVTDIENRSWMKPLVVGK